MAFPKLQLGLMALVLLLLVLAEAKKGKTLSKHSIKYKHTQEWSKWKYKHSRNYSTTLEELERHLIWLSNKKFIDHHNANSHIFGFTLRMNHLGDLTDKEYVDGHYCHQSSKIKEHHSRTRIFEAPPNFNASSYPDSLDWRTKGAVGSVKNQWYGQCGSCYAFSAMGALEGANALAKGSFTSLSEQNILDCSVPYGNYGCSGGNMYNSFMYVIANDGVDTEDSYAYVGRQTTCSYSSSNKGAEMSGIVTVKNGDESSLLAAVYSVGPVSVAVDARSNAFKFYYSGVFSSSRCTSTYLTHSMLITGYGKYSGNNYWLVKNSWGESWGMSGYIMMTRNGYNQCGIASDASYPTL